MPAIRYPPLPKETKIRGAIKPFRFKVDRYTGSIIIPRAQTPDGPKETETFVINGVEAQSKEEWFIYKALIDSGIPSHFIHYQVPWHGGRQMGGQVLDFVISMGGSRIVIRMMGKHWHPTEYGTPLDVFSGSQMRSEGMQVHDIPDNKVKSVEDARHALMLEGIGF